VRHVPFVPEQGKIAAKQERYRRGALCAFASADFLCVVDRHEFLSASKRLALFLSLNQTQMEKLQDGISVREFDCTLVGLIPSLLLLEATAISSIDVLHFSTSKR
jgi:hypothetical protein